MAKKDLIEIPRVLLLSLLDIPSAVEAIAFLAAYVAYRERGEDPLPATPPSLRALMRVTVDEEERRADISRKRREAGRKGGLLNFAQAKVSNPLAPSMVPLDGSPKKGFLLSPRPPINIPKNNPSLNPSLSSPTLPALSCARESETGGFEEFWEAYPKKFALEKARAAWEQVVQDEATAERVMQGLEVWKSSEQWKEAGGRYIPKAFVFLEDARYLVMPAPTATPKKPQSFDIDDFFAAALAKSYDENS